MKVEAIERFGQEHLDQEREKRVSVRLKTDSTNPTGFRVWRVELLFAAPIVAFVIYLFYTWFAVRDRYLIFLYSHDMGPGFDTTPFGWVTVSRYWMSGLVASGAVMVPYIALNLVLGRVVKTFRAPKWWRLWILCAVPLLIVVPAIVMTVNDPVLPLVNAAQVTVVALIGLALAMALGRIAAKRPAAYILLMVDGFALACLLSSLASLEDYPRWLGRGSTGVIYRHLAVFAVGIVLLIIMTALYYWWRRTGIPSAAACFIAGLNIHYLFLPLYHHLCWCKDDGSWTDPDYFAYIPDADNYFARSALFQIGVWMAVALIAFGLTRLRPWLSRRRSV
jgi:hypothetical protein